MVSTTLLLPILLGCMVGQKRASDMVDVVKLCPQIKIDLRYGTKHNGVGAAVYPVGSRCLLRRGTADRLIKVQKQLGKKGLGLLVWDAYRPLSAQKALWAVKPDPRFVAPPARGSRHNRGAAVDLTLVDKDGHELPMPSGFDEFSIRARPTYKGGSKSSRANRDILRAAMMAQGFFPDKNEWWHFNDPDWPNYGLVDVSLRR
ncbi:MAG: M15 family metallopeptidase [Chthonomonadales bacterium]